MIQKNKIQEKQRESKSPSVLKITAKYVNSTGSLAQIVAENISQIKIHHEQLAQLLHDAIAANQQYPENAIELNQKGMVKIGFMLWPDGQLKNSSLLQSSGFELIDNAALTAVASISPMQEASRYLHQPEFFSVIVVFQ